MRQLEGICRGCPLFLKNLISGQVTNCRKALVIKEPVVLFVGQHPGKFEVEADETFVGPTSTAFIEKVKKNRLWDHSVFTNIIKCAPTTELGQEELRDIALHCFPNLLPEIEKYKPSYICLLGEIAAGAFFKQIRMKRPPMGELVQWKGMYVGWTYHPAAAFRNPNLWQPIEDFLRFIKHHMDGSTTTLTDYTIVENEHHAEELIQYFKNSQYISCDFEVDCDQPVPKLRGKTKAGQIIATGISDGKVTAVFPSTAYLPSIRDLIISPQPHKIFHNALFELMWCWRLWGKVPPPRSFSDTLIMFYLLNEDREDHEYGLKYLATKLLGAKPWVDDQITEARKNGLGKLPFSVLAQYNANDAYWTVKLYEYLLPQIKKADLEFLMYEHINPLECLYALATERGVRVDEEYLRTQARQHFEHIMAQLISEIRRLSKGYIRNPRSWQEKQFYIYKVLKIPPPDGKETSNRHLLERLAEEYPQHREILTALIEFSRVDKIYSSYISKWDSFVDVDGRIRPEFKFFGTRTGRLSVEEPPLHNFPSDRTPIGAQARRFIIPSEGYCFLYCDASQFEVRVMANKSGEENLIEAFFRGHDIYTEIASIIFNKPPEEIDRKTERQIAKQAVLGIFYGVSPIGLSQVLRITPQEAETYIRRLQQEFPKVFEYMERIKTTAMKYGFVRNWLGRYRRIYAAIKGDSRALRQVGNFAIQSEASDWWQMVTLWFYRLSFKRLGEDVVFILATIHDSLIAEVKHGYEDHAVKCLEDAFILVSTLWQLKVPIDGEYRFLYNHLGEEAEKKEFGITARWRNEGFKRGLEIMKECGINSFPPKREILL